MASALSVSNRLSYRDSCLRHDGGALPVDAARNPARAAATAGFTTRRFAPHHYEPVLPMDACFILALFRLPAG